MDHQLLKSAREELDKEKRFKIEAKKRVELAKA